MICRKPHKNWKIQDYSFNFGSVREKRLSGRSGIRIARGSPEEARRALPKIKDILGFTLLHFLSII